MNPMEKPEQQFDVNTRIRLRDGIDPGFYGGLSRVGNEGWVRKRKKDKYGYPKILIQWDRNHWAYNGAEDGWTWESHFESTGDTMAEDKQENFEETIADLATKFAQDLAHTLTGAQAALAKSTPETPKESKADSQAEWDQSVAEASNAVSSSKAYVVIALQVKEGEDGKPDLMVPFIFHKAQSEEYSLICQSQVSHVGVMLMDGLIEDKVQRINEDSDEGD